MNQDTPAKRIGPYRILEIVGEGAWGLVYLAEQHHPVRRKVAVKVLKRGLDTHEVLARFEAERQAMAMMSHPNIAQVLDAGATDQGLPYFVMEYVAGEPITKYCDRHRLSIRDRVGLFQQVCEAIQHAHQKGIIHRDLKPSNVLVANLQGRAVPKVIDFGIAKALHQRLTDKTLHTTQDRLIGTPGYMSPETTRTGGSGPNTTTDIYALGVMLYELLAGALPFDVRLLDMESMFKTLREKDPPYLKKRLTAMGKQAEEVARARCVTVRMLKQQVEGDLEWVVARAIDKNRTRRYQATSELVAELGRYMRAEPVLAGPPGVMYQLRKFVARNRAAVATAAMLVILLSGFSVAMALQVRRMTAEAERANRGEATAETASEFLVGLFEVSSPSESLGNTITAKEILDKGSLRIETELVDQPIVQAHLTHTLGNAYQGLGLHDEATDLLWRSVAIRERELGEDHLDLAESLEALAVAHTYQSRFAEARPLFERALSIREDELGVRDTDVARTLRSFAMMSYREGNYKEGQVLAERALAIQDAVLGPDDLEVARTLDLLGILHYSQADHARAELLYLRALAVRENLFGPDHLTIAATTNNLGILYLKMGRYTDAETFLRRTLAICEKLLGPDHPKVERTLNTLQTLAQEAEPMEGETSGDQKPVQPTGGERLT